MTLARMEIGRNRRGVGTAFALLWLAVFSTGCGRGDKPVPVRLLIAASTKDAVKEVADQFTRDTGTEVTLNADDSSKLATQLVNGAPADLFLSANEEWANFVKDKGLAQEVRPLLGNSLVLVVPQDNPAHVSQPADLTGAAVKQVAVAGPTVPAGMYARQALCNLKLWDELEMQKKIVAGENVRVTLAYVEQGEADAGIVYATDAKITSRAQAVYTFPSTSHDRIVYPLVLLRSAATNEGAQRFFAFLRTPAAAEVFRKYGFTTLPGG